METNFFRQKLMKMFLAHLILYSFLITFSVKSVLNMLFILKYAKNSVIISMSKQNLIKNSTKIK